MFRISSTGVRNVARYLRFHWQLTTSTLTDYRTYARSAWANPRNNSHANRLGQLSVYAHALEKGLSHADLRMPFGHLPMANMLTVLRKHLVAGQVEDERVGLAIATGQSVVEEHARHGVQLPGHAQELQDILNRTLDSKQPGPVATVGARVESGDRAAIHSEEFATFVRSRHSVRNFSSATVDPASISEAVATAVHSPSSCNRQPWKVHVASEPTSIRKLLELQGGLRGWDQPGKLLVVAADSAMYGNPYERVAPYVDGGLFAMTLVLALHAEGMATCMLNANQPPSVLSEVHTLLGMDPSELIVCYIALGYPKDSFRVPVSARVPVSSVIRGESHAGFTEAVHRTAPRGTESSRGPVPRVPPGESS